MATMSNLVFILLATGPVAAYQMVAYPEPQLQYTISSSLYYRDGVETSSQDGWFGPLKTRRKNSNNQNSDNSEIDEYFTFLDRRYK